MLIICGVIFLVGVGCFTKQLTAAGGFLIGVGLALSVGFRLPNLETMEENEFLVTAVLGGALPVLLAALLMLDARRKS